MRGRSLRLRLGLAASALITLALALAGLGLVVLFDRVLQIRAAEDLDRTAKFLAGQVVLTPDGMPSLTVDPPDPRFGTPYGGLYWQIGGDGVEALRSRSLWDKRLDVPPLPPGTIEKRTLDLDGPDGCHLIAVSRRVEIDRGADRVPVTIAVAIDQNDLAASRATFLSLLVPALVVLGLALSLAMVVLAGLVGAGGLGAEVTRGLTRMEMGLGLRAGLAIVAVALLMDRVTRSALQRGQGPKRTPA